MRLASYRQNGRPKVGRVDATGQQLFPIRSDITDMVELIEQFDQIEGSLTEDGGGLAIDAIELIAPIWQTRRNIFCVGKNYRDHAREFARSGYEAGAVAGAEIDSFPAVFSKPASTIVGPGAVIELHPDVTNAVDYEVELALVIGRGGRDIKKSAAFDHIFGYTIINDVTARDRQKRHKQWFLGKALDTFCPMGPWITTAEAVDAGNLSVQCRVNGELRQDANTRDLIFDIPTLIETISAGLTLMPGDVIATGTPAGVGAGFDPPRFLKPGDELVLEITGLGTLKNSCR